MPSKARGERRVGDCPRFAVGRGCGPSGPPYRIGVRRAASSMSRATRNDHVHTRSRPCATSPSSPAVPIPNWPPRSARTSGCRCSPSRVTRFANDCLEVQLQANCRERDVFLIQPLVAAGPGASGRAAAACSTPRAAPRPGRITVVMPHYAYARSDKKDAPRISIGGRLVADLLVHGGRRPGPGDDPALTAGARLLQRAGRPPARAARAGRALPAVRPAPHRRGLAGPGQRQGGGGVRAAARRRRWRPAPSSGSRTTG